MAGLALTIPGYLLLALVVVSTIGIGCSVKGINGCELRDITGHAPTHYLGNDPLRAKQMGLVSPIASRKMFCLCSY